MGKESKQKTEHKINFLKKLIKMNLRIFRSLSVKCARLNLNPSRNISVFKPLYVSSSLTKLKFFEPEYLDSTSHLPDVYPLVNAQLKGHNFDILESYRSFVHNLAENMGIDVQDSWATASETFIAKTYDLNSTIIRDGCKVDIFERNVQVTNMRSIDAPILIDILRRTLPEGVELNVLQHQEEHYEARYIPDPFISGITQELAEMEKRHTADIEMNQTLRAEKDAKKAEKKLSELYDDDDDEEDDD